MLRPVLLIAAITGLAVAVPASAQAVDPDVQCLLASNAFSSLEKDPAKKQMAASAALFYAGRLDARLNPAQIKAKVLASGKSLNQQNAGTIMTACAKQLQAKQKALQAMGQEIARAQGAAPK